MKSIAMVWKGSKCSGVIGIMAGLRCLVLILLSLQMAQPLDILLYVLPHAGSSEVSLGKGIGIGNSLASCGRIIVEKLNYPPPQIVVTGNDGLGPLSPVSVLIYELVGI